MKKISKKGIVYIIINPCFQDWVKIGRSANSDIQVRLKELNDLSSTPLPFFAYAVYFVKDPKKVEEFIHGVIDQLNPDLRAKSKLANGKIRKREFFRMKPEEAYGIFCQIASLNDDIKNI